MDTSALIHLKGTFACPSNDEVTTQAITNFADANNFTYQPIDNSLIENIAPGPRKSPAWHGMIGPFARKTTSHVIRGDYRGYPFVAFQLTESLTNGRVYRNPTPTQASAYFQQQTTGVVRLTLPKHFPQILLESVHNDKNGSTSTWVSYSADQRVSLEGDFDAYYNLYVPRGVQIPALQIIAPNFMRILMTSSKQFDVELYGNELIFITRDNLYDPDTISTLSSALDEQLPYFDRLLPSWSYQPSDNTFDTLTQNTLNGPGIRIGNLTLSPARFLVLIIVVFVIFGIFIQYLNSLS